jgi:uncharacterized membrane protein
MRDFSVHVIRTSWGPIDTIFTGAGILILAGGVYASLLLRGIDVVTPAQEELAEGGAA